MMLGVIDTAAGNIQSVVNALMRIGAASEVVADAESVMRADALVLPGVGAFAPAIASLRERGIVDAIRSRVQEDGRPLLGICLGMQLLADHSDENGTHEGLGLVSGRVVPLDPAGSADRVPNFGWHDTTPAKAGTLYPDPDESRSFYFAPSYHFVCDHSEAVASTIGFGSGQVTAAIENGNIFGVQFHPEKSQDAGLDVLHRFCSHIGASAPAS
jgi:glutamine amidotransferase